MESSVNLYNLNQKGKEYILKISIVGNNLRLSCKSLLNPNIKFTRDYSVENLKQIDKVFNPIQTPFEALELIDKTLKKQKVQVKEEVDIIKLNFFFESEQNESPIELKSTEENITTTTNTDFTSSYNYQNFDTQNIVNDNTNINYENTSENYLQNIETTNNTIDTGFDINNYANYVSNDYTPTETQDFTATQNIESIYQTQTQTQDINTYNEYQSTPVENYQTFESNQNYEEYTTTNNQPSTYETTNYEAALYSPPIEEPSSNQFIQTTTTTNTTTITNTFNTNNASDDRIIKLQDDANYLKTEHQNIQNQLSTLSGQLTDYQNKITSIGQAERDNEIQALKNENQLIKQQLQELNVLRKEASEAQYLKTQLSQLNSLREQATESNMIKAQLTELETLKQKINELKNTKNQINELNNLKEEFNQINQLKKQLNELNYKKNQALEDYELKERIKQLENINLQQEKEIKTLRQSQSQSKIIRNKNVNISSGMESRQLYFEEEPEQICVKGDIIHNAQELELITRKINKSNKKITLNLIYKATADSDKAQAFHNKCDKARSTIVLIETNKGKRFGGFTSCSWDGECLEKKDENAFIFSLDKMMAYDNIRGEDAIGCYPKFGPIFMGCQIRIYDNAFAKGGTTFEKGLNFDTQEDYELTGGDREFGIREIEVYEVVVS